MINTLGSRLYVTPDFLDKSYFPSLDGWRAFAVLMVVFGHARGSTSVESLYHILSNWLIYGNLGVRIFFLLSGFLITSLLIKEFQKRGKISLRSFFYKRALRIFPVLYLYLMVLILVNYIFKLGINPDNFYAVAFFYNNFRMSKGEWFNGHTWSLAVEEQYYLIWPSIFLFIQKHLILFCISIISITPFLRVFWYLKPTYFIITLEPFLGYVDTIFFGSLVSILCFKGIISSAHKIWKITGLNTIAFLIVIVLHYMSRQGYLGIITIPLRGLISNIMISFLILDTLINNNSLLFKFLNTKIMIEIGLISYSLYLWQQLFLVPSDLYVGKVTWSIFPLNILFSFLTAYISYHYFEVYFLSLKKKFKSNEHIYEYSN